MTKRLLVALSALALITPACGDDDPQPTTDTSVTDTADTSTADVEGDVDVIDPQVAACRAAIEAKETQNASQLATWTVTDAPEMTRTGGDQNLEADYAGKYRDDLDNHAGCTARDAYGNNVEAFVSDNEADVPAGSPASLDDYPCAAKIYDTPTADADKPVVILVHGNSSSVTSFEEYAKASLAGTTINNVAGFEVLVDTTVRDQLATRLIDAGYPVVSFDARIDRVATLGDWSADSATGNAFMNIDHGWAVPMLQSLVKAVIADNPDRQVSIVGHSLGVTVIRDALRRLYLESKDGAAGAVNPFAHLRDVVLLSGANHGVSSGELLCTSFSHMRGKVGCEMGDRAAFVPTYFTKPINGPSDLFAAPCADGSYAFGEREQCEGNVVQYTTITMEDLPEGALQDEFVSEASSSLDLEPCVTNELIGLGAYDTSGYFFTGAPGFFANHFGSARADAGMTLILSKLAD